MNILIVNPHFPSQLNHGGDLRIINIYKYLSIANSVYMVYFYEPDSNIDLPNDSKIKFKNTFAILKKCIKTNRLNKVVDLFSWKYGFKSSKYCKESYVNFRRKIKEIILEKNIDIIHCHTLDMAQYVYDINSIPKILDIPDSRSLALERIIFNRNSNFIRKKWEYVLLKKINQYEKKISQYFDVSTSVSPTDASYLEILNRNVSVKVIPNGVDIEYFSNYKPIQSKSSNSLVFWGNMDFPPNIDAVKYFCSEILPILINWDQNIKFYIIGGKPTDEILELVNKNVIVTGYVEDLRPYVFNSKVCVIPMRLGSGIKNKILESMSMNIPVVSTTIGALGVDYIDNYNIFIADNNIHFADRIINLLENSSLRKSFSNKAFELVVNKYDWKNIAKEYFELFNSRIVRDV